MKINRQKGNVIPNINRDNIDKVNISLDINILDLMVRYSISTSSLIKRGQFINMKSLIDMISLDFYNNKPGSIARLKFINKALEGRIKYNLEESASIIRYASDHSGIISSDIDLNLKELSAGDIDFINELIRSNLNTSYLYKYVDDGIQKLTAFKTSQPDKLYQCTTELESYVNTLSNQFRQNRMNSDNTKPFSLGSSLADQLQEVYLTVTSSRRRLFFGCQGLNLIVGNGLENGRVYLIIGIAGSGKSTTLLDMALQIKKYNTTYKPKDPTKRPCIVYLTQENTKEETVTRLFQMTTGKNMADCSIDEIYDMMVDSGMCISDESPIDLFVIYKPDRSIDTSYLYSLYDDLSDMGYEMITLIQDHIKKIRSVENEKDTRLELGKVINEFKNFSAIKDLPVVTCSHFNREAAAAVEAAEAHNANTDLLRSLGKHNIGESFLMIDNTDLTLAFQPQYDKDGKRWAGFKILKKRVQTDINQMYQPYYIDNTIKMVEDVMDEPLYLNTMAEGFTGFNNPIPYSDNRPKMGAIAQEMIQRGHIKDVTNYNNTTAEEEIEKQIIGSVDIYKSMTPNMREVANNQMKKIYNLATPEQKQRIDMFLSIDESDCAGIPEEPPIPEIVQDELDKGIEIIKESYNKLPLELQMVYVNNEDDEDQVIDNIKDIFAGNTNINNNIIDSKGIRPFRYVSDSGYCPYRRV